MEGFHVLETGGGAPWINGPYRPPRQHIHVGAHCLIAVGCGWMPEQPQAEPLDTCPCDHEAVVRAMRHLSRETGAEMKGRVRGFQIFLGHEVQAAVRGLAGGQTQGIQNSSATASSPCRTALLEATPPATTRQLTGWVPCGQGKRRIPEDRCCASAGATGTKHVKDDGICHLGSVDGVFHLLL